MTGSIQPRGFPGSSQNRGVRPDYEGLILQQGGEEIFLEKLPDRFTLQVENPDMIPLLAQRVGATVSQEIAAAKATELRIAPEACEQAISTLRQLPGVRFVCHVYQPRFSPVSVIYLINAITVQFAPWASEAEIQRILTEYHLIQVEQIPGLDRAYGVKLTPQSPINPLKVANRLIQEAAVMVAEPEVVTGLQRLYRPQDDLYPRQWYLHHNGGRNLSPDTHINAEAAWDITRGDRAIVVAVIDDSFELSHADFQGRGKIVAPYNFKEGNDRPLPFGNEVSHGTGCAGVAIAEETGTGIVGVAPGCAFMPLRYTGSLDPQSVEAWFNWAIDHGAAVISCSWGPAQVRAPLHLRVRNAITRAATQGRNGKGCVVVFAAGNANRPVDGSTVHEHGWPGNLLQGEVNWLNGYAVHPDVITVSACTSLGQKAAYSNWGDSISICAPSNNAPPCIWLEQTGLISTPPAVESALPGEGVFTLDRLGVAGYGVEDFNPDFGGTSSACPIVAGVAALMLSANPNLTAREVKQILQQTADKIVDRQPDSQWGHTYGTYEANGHSRWFGYGKVNAGRAVQAAQYAAVGDRVVQGHNTARLDIPDNDPNGVVSSIQLQGLGQIDKLSVTVDLYHGFLGDISLYLISPDGQSCLLQGRTLGRLKRLQKTYQSTEMSQMAALHRAVLRGLWQLKAIDHAPQDIGYLQSWSLQVTTRSP